MTLPARSSIRSRPAAVAGRLALVLLSVEVLDELVDGARGAAWPLVRDELSLDYAAIGALTTVPALVANLVEPLLGVLGDRHRRAVVLGGGIAFSAALALVATAASAEWLMLAYLLFFPASGAFVSLGQATLMDADPARRDANMARWGFAGSLGSLLGPLLLSASVALSLGWRGVFAALAAAALAGVGVLRALPFGSPPGDALEAGPPGLLAGLRQAAGALRGPGVARSLVLLELADLLLDVLLALVALYLVDVAGASPAVAALAVVALTGAGLAGDVLVLWLLGRGAAGPRLVRLGAAAALLVFPAFLLAPATPVKLGLLALLGVCTAPWYPVLKAGLYASLPGRSGTAMAVGSVAGMLGASFPLLLGLAADRIGLGAMMWLLLIAPLALVATPPPAPAGSGRRMPAMERKIRVLIAKPGLDGHDRGAKVVARALRDAGMEVVYTGLRQTAEMIVNAAVQEDVDAIGLSVLSGAHMHYFEEVRRLLAEREAGDILLFGGGIIPDEDRPRLRELGVDAVFTPGASTQDPVEYLRQAVPERWARDETAGA